MPKNPTLREIAARADVALSTVSQVLNNKANVSPEMRERVLEAAEALGYRQRVTTSAVVKNELSTVGVLTRRIEGEPLTVNPFYSPVIAGIEHECQRHGMNLMYANLEVDARSRTASYPAMLLNELIGGVIVIGAFLDSAIADISRRAGRNIVLVDSYTEQDGAFDRVVIDNFNGALTAVSHLISRGHHHIGLIGSSPDSYPSIAERRRGYFAALARAGINADDSAAYVETGELKRRDAFEATLRLLRRAPEVTAIFACNDETAFGVMSAARHLGRSIPEDLSVIGFDDIDLAQEVIPPLTTLHVDKVLMGTMALRMLRDRATDPQRAAITTVINTQLIARGTVRPLP
ncbi:MAG: LacI family DNA-binding transcriptional regulator [Anaerolineae bacterium]